MTVSFSTFDRLKSKGVEAYKAGDYHVARSYLVEAAECIIELAAAAKSEAARRQHEELAAELIELAKDCDWQSGGGSGRRVKPTLQGGGGAGGGIGGGGGRVKPALQGSGSAPDGGRAGFARRGPGSGARQGVKEDDSGADASDWMVRDRPKIGFDDIAGLDDVKQEIRLKMIYPFLHRELAGKYGIGAGGGILLYGPPGTGKTMIAKAIAHEIDAAFFLVSPAQIMSKWVGEAEQNVRKLFDAAKSEPTSVIFLDETEALVPKRQSDSSTVMQRVVPQILQELEGFDRTADRALLFVGATNRPWMLDEAMLRPGRLDAKVYVPLPDAPARYRLLELSFEGRPMADDVDFGVLCDRLAGYSGADIKSIAQKAAERPFLEAVGGAAERAISMQDVLTEISETHPSVQPSDLIKYEKFANER
ncbi:MAG: ATP-binding protein [Planctomycetes bacterium]|nr:ATP-binding protein [Planctomycetota bacterium]MBI3833056.1 ATP-binding protein [Planctomycetota bacterium]